MKRARYKETNTAGSHSRVSGGGRMGSPEAGKEEPEWREKRGVWGANRDRGGVSSSVPWHNGVTVARDCIVCSQRARNEGFCVRPTQRKARPRGDRGSLPRFDHNTLHAGWNYHRVPHQYVQLHLNSGTVWPVKFRGPSEGLPCTAAPLPLSAQCWPGV